MIKKIFVILSLSTFIINLSFATDLLADLTNGKLTDNSPGVKVLSLDEKKSVKGGYRLLETNAGQNVFLFENISGAGVSFTRIGVIPMLTRYETANKVSCGFGLDGCSTSYINKQAYNEFISVANPNLGEFLAVTATKTTTIGLFGVPQYNFATSGMIVGINSNGSIYKIRNAGNNRITREVLSKIENDLNKILFTQYR